ncbi:MAG: hypothetical protein JST54_15520 [Deltaproteobacteria bacterium]|nr:hypothetical protein [Deltaproteobacteria bacterium]
MPAASDSQLAWQSAVASVALTMVGLPLDFFLSRRVDGMPVAPYVVTFGFALLLLALLFVERGSLPVAALHALFLANNIAVAGVLWLTRPTYAEAQRLWLPFEPYRLSVLAIALLAPPRLWVGASTIALFVGSGVLRFFTLDPDVQARLSPAAPVALCAFGVFSVVLLINRLRSRALAEALAASRAKTAVLEGVTRRFLAIRDLANSPLQTLEATMVLLANVPGAEVHAQRMARALERLRAWNALLQESPSAEAWDRERESFDAAKVLGKPAPPS